LDLIENGDLALLYSVLTAAAGLADGPIAAGIAMAMLLLDSGGADQARQYAQAAAEHATTIQRRPHAFRLRSFATVRPC
jgi:hypothetical protein